MARTHLEIIDALSIALHEARRTVICERSSNIAAALREERARIDAVRAEAGLSPSPVEPTWEGEESDE